MIYIQGYRYLLQHSWQQLKAGETTSVSTSKKEPQYSHTADAAQPFTNKELYMPTRKNLQNTLYKANKPERRYQTAQMLKVTSFFKEAGICL